MNFLSKLFGNKWAIYDTRTGEVLKKKYWFHTVASDEAQAMNWSAGWTYETMGAGWRKYAVKRYDDNSPAVRGNNKE